MANKKKHEFMDTEFPAGKFLICPQCQEYISYIDIESFPNCPFCNYHLGNDPELEDFVLQPLIERWSRQFRSRGF